MDGNETEYTQEGDTWTAHEGKFEGKGRDKDEAARALLESKAKEVPAIVSEQTIANKMELGQKLEASVSRVVVKRLKQPLKDGTAYTAYYDDNPDLQGLGVNEAQAKIALFKKHKEFLDGKK